MLDERRKLRYSVINFEATFEIWMYNATLQKATRELKGLRRAENKVKDELAVMILLSAFLETD